jgi:hypothetical protein
MNIDLCFHIFKFEKRLKWVLSSLNQQVDNPFKFHIKVAAHATKDNFRHLLDEMPKTFPNLDIEITYYTDDSFNARSTTRTNQIKSCTSEWLLFLDGDNVFPPSFFKELYPIITTIYPLTKKQVFSVPRLTMDARHGYALVDSDDKPEITDAYAKAAAVKTHLSMGGRISAAGYFQLVHVPTMREMGINEYVKGEYDSPILDKVIKFNTRSDVVFRHRFKGVHPIKTLPHIVHLNHFRRALDTEYDFDKCN